tara:strand:+ start:293 stop:787 length:495 start_codon:yes stop_codon:yes gene_type:complete
MVTLNIKADNEVVASYYKHHGYFHAGDVGLDLFCPESFIVEPHSTHIIDFGISCELVTKILGANDNLEDFNAIKTYEPYLLVPRSSISKHALIMLNSIGIIDAGYRGNLQAAVFNYTNFITTINTGDRLFQIIRFNGQPISKVKVVQELSKSTRNDGSFGSTGK